MPRFYVRDGKLYVIRDVLDGQAFVGCEYAVLTPDGAQIVWRDCPEGANFSEIEPLAEVSE